MTVRSHDWSFDYEIFARLFKAAAILAALTGSGCFAPSLAPLAVQAGEMAGAGMVSAAGRKSGIDGTADSSESEERCDELALQVPNTIELRMANRSPTAWRRLQLGGSSDAPAWEAVTDDKSDAAGWRPLTNLERMSFASPIQQGLKRGKATYMAYAPAEPRTAIERDQLVALTADFGAELGTFQWNGRPYQYTVVNRLPCFPGSALVVRQTNG